MSKENFEESPESPEETSDDVKKKTTTTKNIKDKH